METAAPYTLLAVVAGYLFTKRAHLTSFRIERLSGYLLLFESAIWGVVLLGVSHLLLAFLGTVDSPTVRFLGAAWRSHTPVPGLGTFSLALLLGMSLPSVLNLVIGRPVHPPQPHEPGAVAGQ